MRYCQLCILVDVSNVFMLLSILYTLYSSHRRYSTRVYILMAVPYARHCQGCLHVIVSAVYVSLSVLYTCHCLYCIHVTEKAVRAVYLSLSVLYTCH